MADEWSSEMVRSVIIPYLCGLLDRSGRADDVEIRYYDAHVPIIHTDSPNHGTFSIVVGRVEISWRGLKLVDDSYCVLRRLDYSTDDTALSTLIRLVDKYRKLHHSACIDDGEAWFSNYTSGSVLASTDTIVTPAKIG
jgi:hypothetical protein